MDRRMFIATAAGILAVPLREFVDAGGLMAYGTDLRDLFRRAATYVDKILRGQAGRSTRRAADEVRAGHQPEDRQGPRPDDPPLGAASGG
jgi:hypothetical protein